MPPNLSRLKVFHSDHYAFPLPDRHRFPQEKYRLLREALLRDGVLDDAELVEAQLAPLHALTLAHTERYVRCLLDGSVDPKIMRRIGLPWSPELMQRSLASVGGTLSAGEEAIENMVSGNLAGGTHHATADAGEGFCVFNDIAVAILYLLEQGMIKRAAVVDLDVHQGKGNAAILGQREEVFVFSMHGEKNYPFQKVPSTLDVELPDHTGDTVYLSMLRKHLPAIFHFEPDIIFYQAGVDPLKKEDRLGRLSLTLGGLAERDRVVLSFCHSISIPVALTLGGGYGVPIELTVQAHVQTYRLVKEIFLEEKP